MSLDRRWRQKIEALRRAGLGYVAKERLLAGIAAAEEQQSVEHVASVQESTAATEVVRAEATESEANAKKGTEIELQDKNAAMSQLAAEVSQCMLCQALCTSRTQTVFSDGSSEAELCFVGEAPGADEDKQGVPFVGRAGQLLTKIIEACKLSREEVYICNVLKCRPPDNRNPTAPEIANCRPFLDRQLELVRPKMMVALGKYAAAHLLCQKPEETPITKLRGQIREYRGIPFMITFHPAYLLRNASAKREVWEDMKTVMRRLGRPVD